MVVGVPAQARAAARLQPDDDVIVGFPTEDEGAFQPHFGPSRRPGSQGALFPYPPRPGTTTTAADTRSRCRQRDRSSRLRAYSDAACRRAGGAGSETTDTVLIDVMGLGYADDYTPWLVDAPVGAMVRARAVGVSDRGVLAVAA